MGFSINTLPYTGGSQTFDLSFALGYIEESDVTVQVVGEVDGTGQPINRTFVFNSENEIEVVDPLPNPCEVRLVRTVNKENPPVDFSQPGSATRGAIELNSVHTLMAVQEALDGRIAGSEFTADQALSEIREGILQSRAWAEEDEDTEADSEDYPGEFSARHHALKAAASASEAEATAASVVYPWVNVQQFGDITTGSGFTAALQAAVDSMPSTGGVIQLPSGTYSMAELASRSVGTNEGTGVVLSAGDDNITIRGQAGATRLVPTSNEIEMFLINGADNVRFEGVIFDNSGNGVLRDQVKVDTYAYTITGGVAGYGNAANCAIRQVRGSGLSVTECGFQSFNIAVEYIGYLDDDQVLSGAYEQRHCWFDAGVQGPLAHQPEQILITGSRCSNGIDSENSGGSLDPGHQVIYLTNRTGAAPRNVVISDCTDYNATSSPVKIRKGETVTVNNISAYRVGRGIEMTRVQQGSVTGFAIELVSRAADSNQNGLEAVDCGDVTFTDGVVNVQGVDAWGVRIRQDAGAESWMNNGVTVTGTKIKMDNSAAAGKAACVVEDQSNANINILVQHSGTIASGHWPIDAEDCTSCTFSVQHRAPDSPSDAYRLVELGSGCTECRVIGDVADVDTEFEFGTGSSSSIYDQGTDTVVSVSGYVTGTWTPTVTWSSVNTGWVTNPTVAHGEYRQYWGYVVFNMKLDFTPTKGSASGNMEISMPVTSKVASSLSNYPCTLGEFDYVDVVGDCIQVNPTVMHGTSTLQLSQARSGTSNNSWISPSQLAGTDGVQNYNITVHGEYPA